ncbi:MAG: VOC family protein, partial [Gemmatimonadota bacterium]
MELRGVHHVTAVTADVRANLRFYTGVLGMRLVKRSVNQDDVKAYHLFYADAAGTPGTDLTFFDWDLPRERRGTRSIVRTHLRVADGASLEWWSEHLRSHDVVVSPPLERDGRMVLDFEDPEGQRLSLLADEGAGDAGIPWEGSVVPEEHQIRGLGPVVMSVPAHQPTDLI